MKIVRRLIGTAFLVVGLAISQSTLIAQAQAKAAKVDKALMETIKAAGNSKANAAVGTAAVGTEAAGITAWVKADHQGKAADKARGKDRGKAVDSAPNNPAK